MKTNAIAAAQFIEDRKAAGLPVASDAQLKRAKRLVDGNPMLRSHHTSLGMQLLALKLPTTRFERAAERARLRKEYDAAKADDSKAEDVTASILADLSSRIGALELKPYRCRGTALKVEASAEAVGAFVESNPGMTAVEAAQSIAGMSGYSTPIPAMRRVARHLKAGAGRMPSHIREKALMLSAIAQAGDLIAIRDRAAEAAA